MPLRRRAANSTARDQGSFAVKPRYLRSPVGDQVLASAENTVSGAWAITARRARAGPRGRRLPCSQLRMVSTGTPSRLANSSCVKRARRRRSRTAGAASAGATEGVTGAMEFVPDGARTGAGASGNSCPSRSSTIRPSAFSRRRCMLDSISRRDPGRKTGIGFLHRK